MRPLPASCRLWVGSPPRAHRSAGFTLIELITVLAILVILSALAAPSFQRLLMQQRMSSTASSIHALLWFARGETIKRNAPVSVEIAANAPWIVYRCVNGAAVCDEADRDVLQEVAPAVNALGMVGRVFRFGPRGRLTAGMGSFEIADASGSIRRCLSVSTAARTLTHRGACP